MFLHFLQQRFYFISTNHTTIPQFLLTFPFNNDQCDKKESQSTKTMVIYNQSSTNRRSSSSFCLTFFPWLRRDSVFCDQKQGKFICRDFSEQPEYLASQVVLLRICLYLCQWCWEQYHDGILFVCDHIVLNRRQTARWF